MKRIIITTVLIPLLIYGCGKTTREDQKTGYPERKHGDEEAMLVLTKHQLEHIEFAIERAEMKTVTVPLTLPARIALNEWSTAQITARVTGRIDKVHRVPGDRVRKGGAVIEIFSQEFLTMQSEFVAAEERLKRMADDQPEYGISQAIYESARTKLQVVGLLDSEIDDLADLHVPLTLLPVRSPLAGALISGEVRMGEYVAAGKELFTVADLRALWVIADVFEHDLPLIEEGLRGEVSVDPYPTDRFKVRLVRIYDMVDEHSRTIKVRFEVDNSREKLKPEMFATVNVNTRFGGKTLKVPSSSVLTNGGEAYVFVSINDTTFEQRKVKAGFETKEYTEVLSGLKPGERVVSKGTFYLKSELAKSTFVEEE